MRQVLIAALLLTAAPVMATAKPAEGPSRTFTARDLFSLEAAKDPQIRPDGGAIAYVRSSFDIMTDKAQPSIWLVDPDTGAQRPLVSGPGAHFSPRWSPDGKRLAYVSTVEGRPQLFVRWMDSGVTARLTGLPQAPGSIAWSPDGKLIAFSMFIPSEAETLGAPMEKPEGAQWAEPLQIIGKVNYRADGAGYLKPGFNHIFLVSADGGSPRQLTFGAFDDDGPLSWTPDSRAILFSGKRGPERDREPLDSEVFQLSIADGGLTPLTKRFGPDEAPAVSPDGKLVAFVGYDDKRRAYENALLYVMDRSGGAPRALTTGLDRSVESPVWAADGKSIYVQYADHGVTKVARVSLDGRVQPVAEGLSGGGLDRPYSGGEFTVSKGGLVAFTAGTPAEPSDVAVAGKGATKRLTRLNEDLFLGKTLARVESLPVASSFDKRPIDAWIMTPPNFDPAKKYPLLLEIHGGPFASYAPVFASELQLYAAAGYVVVYANPRGSTSYGAEFANLIDKKYPSEDYDDLMSVVDAAIAKGFVDPNNLFVTGGSGGGLLTAWIVGKTGRFKAAVSQKPVVNWTSLALTSDGYTLFGTYWMGKQPWEDPQLYWKQSPLSLVGNVTTPTMVLVGEEDHRTPPAEAEQLYQALQLRKVPAMLVRVPGASHGGLAERPSQLAAEAAAIIAWFDRYRTPADKPPQ